jgi:hypothetical protein
MTTAWLRSHDAPTWPDVAARLAGATCAWADLDGWHVGTAPDTEPVGTTHIWAWEPSRQLVVRLGGYLPIVVELAAEQVGEAIEVSIMESTGLGWVDGDKGVSIQHTTESYRVISVLGPAPLTFVAE